MTSQRLAQTNQQQKSEKPQASGILKRATVRSVSDVGEHANVQKELKGVGNSAFHQDFCSVPIGNTIPQPVRAKLRIGSVGDKYEQEADREADRVVEEINGPRKRESGVEWRFNSTESRGSEQKLTQLGALPLRRRTLTNSVVEGQVVKPEMEAAINRARVGGKAMGEPIKSRMEQAFGGNFSGVRVYNDERSWELNTSLGARAFTYGQDVFFQRGEYNTGSRVGQELLAHELTHVMQQKGRAVAKRKKTGTERSGRESMDLGSMAEGIVRNERLQRATVSAYYHTQYLDGGNLMLGFAHERVDMTNPQRQRAMQEWEGLNEVWPGMNIAPGMVPGGAHCHHHIPYRSVRMDVLSCLRGKTVREVVWKLSNVGRSIVPHVYGGGRYMQSEIDESIDGLIADLANNGKNLFYWPTHRGDNGGTQIDWPTSPHGVSQQYNIERVILRNRLANYDTNYINRLNRLNAQPM